MIEAPERPKTKRQFGQPGKSIEEFLQDGHFIRVLIGGRGCIHGDTIIHDPEDGSRLTVKERFDRGHIFHVKSLRNDGAITTRANPPFLKGRCRLLKISTKAATVRVAPDHKFLTPVDGWRAANTLHVGSLIAGHSPVTVGNIRYREIVEITEEEQEEYFYDFEVPFTHNYLAEGLWHHNSGKTFGLAADITAHIWQNAGAKAIVARETETSQADSSIDTFSRYFDELGGVYSPALGLFKSWNNGRSFRIPSRLAIERMQKECAHMHTRSEIAHWIKTVGDGLCGRIEFRGLPAAEKGKFRGMECSYFAMVEADQIVRKQFELALACLRWKGADPESCDEKGFIRDRCVTLDSNPPSPSHWIAELEKEEMEKPASERVMRFWHLSTYENEHNLPDNYIRDMILLPYANNPPMIERMLYGRYADAFDGKPVYYAYRRDRHEAENLPWLKGATLVVGMDVGTNNASIISAYKVHGAHLYWWTLKEIILTGSDTDRQCEELLKVLANQFPFWNRNADICPQTLFFCDPAARNSAFTKSGPTSSALKVMQSHGIYPGMKVAAHLQPTIATVNRLLQQNHLNKTSEGDKTVWHFKIDTKNCPTLTRALRGAYRYPSKDEPGYGSDQPLKGSLCDHVDHPCFVAGTLIETSAGLVPIESVKVGDMALTRKGWRRVVKAALSARNAEVWTLDAGNHTLTGTGNHPIWTQDGWKPLAELTHCDTLIECEPNAANTEARFTGDTPTPSERQIDCTSKTTRPICTGKFGLMLTDKFLKGTPSTTETETPATTHSTTSRVSPRRSTPPSTGRQSAHRHPPSTLLKFAIKLRNGIAANRARNGIASTPSGSTLERRLEPSGNAIIAGRNTLSSPRPEFLRLLAFVPTPAKAPADARQGQTTSGGSARTAEQSSRPAATARPGIAVKSVQQSGVADVYNLTVEDAHEYFANGILVSNCDAFRYGVVNVMDIAQENHQGGMKSAQQPVENPEPKRTI